MRTIVILLVAISLGLATRAASAELIPAEEIFGNSLVRTMEISPDGKHVALTFEEETEVKLTVMRLADREFTSTFAFGENMHVLDFWWASDSRLVMGVGKVTGNLDNYGRSTALYAANIDGSVREQIFVTERSGVRVLHPLPDDENHVLVARYHYADQGVPKGNLLNVFDGTLRYLSDQPVDPDMSGLVADNDGQLRGALAVKVGDSLDDIEFRIYAKSGEKWEMLDVPSARATPTMNFLGFSADNQQVYFLSNHDMPTGDRMGVFRYDFDSQDIDLMYRHDIVDARGLLRTPGAKVLGAYGSFGHADYSLFDDQVEAQPEEARMLAGLLNAFPQDDVFITSVTRDGKKSIVAVAGDRNPGEFYLFDSGEMQLQFLAASRPELDKTRLVPMETVRIEARDGLMLNAFLTRPRGAEKKLPLILNVHGGPFGIADRWGFNPEAQFFAQHGYATLQVNFRGSGNRGQDFEQAGWREWGGEMQDDLTDATRWAIDQGIADAERICIYGGSYGGYATLMGVVKEPDLYQCGVGYVGVYDLSWFREGDGSDFSRGTFRAARQNFERFMSSAVGDSPEAVKPVSPVEHVDRIEAALFIVHGEADVRVPVGHAYRVRDALDAVGMEYEWMIKEKEGHGFYDVGNRVELYTRMLAFFEEHIGGAQ